MIELTDLIEIRHKEATDLPPEISADLAAVLAYLAREAVRAARLLRSYRLLRWFIRRFVVFKLVLELLEQSALLVLDVEDLLFIQERVLRALESCTCEDDDHGNDEPDKGSAPAPAGGPA